MEEYLGGSMRQASQIHTQFFQHQVSSYRPMIMEHENKQSHLSLPMAHMSSILILFRNLGHLHDEPRRDRLLQ